MSPSQVGGRDLFRVVYSYLAELDDSEVYLKDAAKVYGQATNMTDRFNMLALLSHYPSSEQKDVLLDFYDRYKDQTLVVQKWIGAQASSSSDDVLEKLRELEELPEFDIKVPNLVRSLVGTLP